MDKIFVFFLVFFFFGLAKGSKGDWVLTPGGYRHKDCVHEVEPGSQIEHQNDVLHVSSPSGKSFYIHRCQYPRATFQTPNDGESFQGGWQVYTKEKVGNDMTALLGQWNVPSAPQKYNGQTIFLFTGMQNIDWVPPNPGPNDYFDIIQPVLQYGPSAAGGGEYWTLASWYVPLGGWFDSSIFSKLIKVNSGDVIFGNITRVGPTSFYIDSYDVTTKQHTDITVDKSRLKEQPWAYVTLEAYADYNQLTCDQYPTEPVTFSNLKLLVNGKEEPLKWTVEKPSQFCSQNIMVNNFTTVTIQWQ